MNGKKYGLVFEEHREEIDEVLATHTPVLSEEKDLFIDNGGNMNFLIEGDNLASLKLLKKTHKGSIDLIYIDPPYNTGNKDFVYDDCYIDVEDGFRHSKWSSFMSKRLQIARSLLTEQGVIFIQISDIELAQLRLLFDSVFGEDNFLNIISVNMKNIAGASGGGEDKRLKKNCEYVLIYAKHYDMMPIFNGAYVYTELSELIQKYISDNNLQLIHTTNHCFHRKCTYPLCNSPNILISLQVQSFWLITKPKGGATSLCSLSLQARFFDRLPV